MPRTLMASRISITLKVTLLFVVLSYDGFDNADHLAFHTSNSCRMHCMDGNT